MSDWNSVVQPGPEPPRFIGADLEPFPFISGFGLLWRMTRLAHLMPVELSSIGMRNRPTLDILSVLARPCAHTRGLLQALGLESSRVANYWNPEVWSPLRTQRAFQRQAAPLKRCPSCSLYGYHSVFFQLPNITRCPWHDLVLSDRCNECGVKCWARFDDACRLGRCSCGYDPIDARLATTEMWSFPTAEAESWICRYLNWADGQRTRRWLVAPDNVDWSEGFARLAPVPPALQRSSSSDDTALPAEQATDVLELAGEGDEPPERAFWGWCLLAGDRPLTYAPLPESLHPKLCDATRSVVTGLPSDCPTPFDLAIAHGLEERVSFEENINARPDCFFAPHGVTVGGSTWLYLSAVDMSAIVFCGQLISTCLTASERSVEVAQCSQQAAESLAIDKMKGRRHLASSLEAVLLQGYRQGLGTIARRLLGTRVPTAPCVRFAPTAEIVGGPDGIEAIRLAWVLYPDNERQDDTRRKPPVPPSPARSRSRQATPVRSVARRGTRGSRPKGTLFQG